MELILGLILLLIFLNFSSGNGENSSDGDDFHRFTLYRDDSSSIDPADTFHLEDGLDHEVDDDGYCEECDDYHEHI